MKKVLVLFLLLIPAVQAVVINEVMYNPLGLDSYNEWVELYNPSAEAVNISNWTVCGNQLLEGYINRDDGLTYSENGMIIPPGGFAVVTDGGTGTDVYDNFSVNSSSLALHVNASSICGAPGLNNNFENITLNDSSDFLNDSVNYDDPVAEGFTLERMSNGSWSQSLYINGTPGSQNSVETTTTTTTTIGTTSTTTTATSTITTTVASTTSTTTTTYGSTKLVLEDYPDTFRFGRRYTIDYTFRAGDESFEKLLFVAYLYEGHNNICQESDGRSFKYSDSGYAKEMDNIDEGDKIELSLKVNLKENCDRKYDDDDYTLRGRVYIWNEDEDDWEKYLDKDKTVYVKHNDRCEEETTTTETTTTEETTTIEEEGTGGGSEQPTGRFFFVDPFLIGILILGFFAIVIIIKTFPFRRY